MKRAEWNTIFQALGDGLCLVTDQLDHHEHCDPSCATAQELREQKDQMLKAEGIVRRELNQK